MIKIKIFLDTDIIKEYHITDKKYKRKSLDFFIKQAKKDCFEYGLGKITKVTTSYIDD